jgi:hypothetical protein
MSQAYGRAVGEGDYWAGVGRQVQGREAWATIRRALLCSRYIRDGCFASLALRL